MQFVGTFLHRFFLFFLICTLCGCFSKNTGRHLSSDVCLLFPEKTTKQEVVQQLGSPQIRQSNDSGEVWIYYQVHKSFFKKVPWAGNYLGKEEYEVVTVSFTGSQIRACVFRAMNVEEFQSLGILIEE